MLITVLVGLTMLTPVLVGFSITVLVGLSKIIFFCLVGKTWVFSILQP